MCACASDFSSLLPPHPHPSLCGLGGLEGGEGGGGDEDKRV